MRTLDTDHPTEVSLVDFVDSHPSSENGSALLEISSAIVREVRHQVHERGEWPTLTPDQIFVSSSGGNWAVSFKDYGTYSEGELDVGTTHRMKCVRDIYRLTYFLGTGEFPLYVDPLEGRSFDRKTLPGVPRKLLALYRDFFSPDPGARPGTLFEIQSVIDKRKRGYRFFGPVGVICAVAAIGLALGIASVIQPEDESSTIVTNSKYPGTAVEGEVFLAAAAEGEVTSALNNVAPVRAEKALAEAGIGIAEQADVGPLVGNDDPLVMPEGDYPNEPQGTLVQSSQATDIELGNQSTAAEYSDNAVDTLAKMARVPPSLDVPEQLTEPTTPMAAAPVEFNLETLEQLSLEWIRNGSPEQKRQALELLKKGHEKGNAEATYLLAECYFYGEATDQNVSRAIELLEVAYLSKNGKAASMLATICSKGLGVEQDFARARMLYQDAISFGSEDAKGNLGVLLLKGQGGDSDPEGAVELFRHGAEGGDPVATFYLAKCLEVGIGGERNLDEASKWYVVAASAGNPKAIEWCRERNIFISAVSRNP